MAEKPFVKRIEIENFMSHQKFALDFGPDMNIIIGKNGSGKSSILTALMIGFGGSASRTKRGEGLADLIKHGAQTAYITITLHNPPSLVALGNYGATITVVRRIAKSSSSYMIKDESMKTVSTKVDELKRILFYYGIYPDNTLAMLNQESAKEFLVSDSAKIKYARLMDALRVTKFREHAMWTQNEIRALDKNIQQSEQNVAILNKKAELEKRWVDKLDEVNASSEQINLMEAVIAWRKVERIKELNVEDNAALVQLEQSIVNMTERLTAMEANIAEVDATDFQEEIDAISRRRQETNDDISTLERQKRDQMMKRTQTEERCRLASKDLDQAFAELKVAEDFANGSGGATDSRESFEKEIADIDIRVQTNESEVQQLETSRDELRASLIQVTKDFETRQQSRKGDTQRLRQFEAELSKAEAGTTGSNKLDKYNERLKIKAICSKIQAASALWRKKPIGPLAEYVTIKDHTWSPILETVLNTTLTSFWVQTKEDRDRLSRIVSELGSNAVVIMRGNDRFDYSHTLPPSSDTYKRVVDVLRFDNEDILRLFIDHNHIESNILLDDRTRALQLTDPKTKDKRIGLAFVKGDRTGHGFQIGSSIKNVSETKPVENWRSHNRMKVSSRSDEIKQLKANIEDAREEISRVNISIDGVWAEKRELEERIENLTQRIRKFEADSAAAKHRKSEIKKLVLELPEENIDYGAQLLEAKTTVTIRKRYLENVESSLSESVSLISTLDEKLCGLKNTLQQVLVAQEEMRKRQRNRTEQRRQLLRAQAEGRETQAKREESRTKLLDIQRKRQAELNAATESAQKLALSSPDLRDYDSLSDETIQTKIRDLKAARDHFAANEVQNESRKRNFDALVEEIDGKRESIALLRTKGEELEKRMDKRQQNENEAFQLTRQMIERNYQHILGERGFSGNLVINDDQKTFIASANPQQMTGNRNIGSLSGGEKSFTQLALLLSVWQSMSVGLVAMDEYDVFMDKFIRTVSLDCLLKTVESKNLQCILITPQDLGGDQIAKRGDSVKIHRLKDPVREAN